MDDWGGREWQSGGDGGQPGRAIPTLCSHAKISSDGTRWVIIKIWSHFSYRPTAPLPRRYFFSPPPRSKIKGGSGTGIQREIESWKGRNIVEGEWRKRPRQLFLLTNYYWTGPPDSVCHIYMIYGWIKNFIYSYDLVGSNFRMKGKKS